MIVRKLVNNLATSLLMTQPRRTSKTHTYARSRYKIRGGGRLAGEKTLKGTNKINVHNTAQAMHHICCGTFMYRRYMMVQQSTTRKLYTAIDKQTLIVNNTYI